MKTTPLTKIHRQLGARMIDFAGWEMPVQYTGIREEHLAVRQKAGIFDVSHMGEIEIQGTHALEIVQNVTCNDAARLKSDQSQYSAILTEQGTFVDDVIVNRLGGDLFLICVNASNSHKDFEWILEKSGHQTSITDRSDDYFLVALQGPDSEKLFSKAFPNVPVPAKPFTLAKTKLNDCPVIISRTGYTGEDGFEIYGDPKNAEMVWNQLQEKGAFPCGLGARDTLRLEAAYPLYGHEIDDATNPYEAGLGWIVKLDKGDFIGREALLKIPPRPPLSKGGWGDLKQLVGIEMTEPGIARQGCKIYDGEKEIGMVTSGTKSPLLDKAIALGYVKTSFAPEGTKLSIDIHHKKRQAVIVSLPFYKRK